MQKKNEDCLKVGILGIRGRMGQAIMHESDRVPGLGTDSVAVPAVAAHLLVPQGRACQELGLSCLQLFRHFKLKLFLT